MHALWDYPAAACVFFVLHSCRPLGKMKKSDYASEIELYYLAAKQYISYA